MVITPMHVAGFVAIILFIVFLGIYQGKKVKTSEDFDLGGKSAGASVVAMTLCGTLIGGSSTVGTAELAYTFGYSAWWFTLGSSLGALLLGFVYARPLCTGDRDSTTIQDIIRKEYGTKVATICSILSAIGIVINTLSQTLSLNAMLSAMFDLSIYLAVAIAVIVMAAYVAFGGLRATAILGKWKMILLYAGTLLCGVLAIKMAGGFSGFGEVLPKAQYFNLLGRGANTDLAAGLSVALGTISTQTYIQATLSGSSVRTARRGCFIAAALTPPIGFLSMYVGMYMKINFPDIRPAMALPLFVITYMPDLVAGIILATLFITIVGAGAGMALGFGTVVTNDIYKQFINKNANSRTTLFISRTVILITLIVGGLFTISNGDTPILTFGILSLGLRAAIIPLPFTAALFMKGKFDRFWAGAASVSGLAVMLLCEFVGFPLDSLVCGLIFGLVCMTINYFKKKRMK